MLRNYFRIAFRNITKNKLFSLINIGGLAVGITVTLLISLWIVDEISFEKYHANYAHVTQIVANSHAGDEIVTQTSLPFPLATELKTRYGGDFRAVAATLTIEHSLGYNDVAVNKIGMYAQADFTKIISLDMVAGNPGTLQDAGGNILISETAATILFGDASPIGKVIKLNGSHSLRVGGVYKNMPKNTQFSELQFIAPAGSLVDDPRDFDNWYNSSFQMYALLNTGADASRLQNKIRNVYFDHTNDAAKPLLALDPMSKWHLYTFKNGQLVPGRLQFVWLFGIIGFFVLLIACINFMNLSTARSEKRAKEVGIRKVVGSLRVQLVKQFFGESFLMVLIAFVLAVFLLALALPWFNELAGKDMTIVWNNPLIWLCCIAFCMVTGLLAGVYPALYLSAFNPLEVLKGKFKTGRAAATPRKVLVVVQFTVSIILIIGTLTVFKQVNYAKNRPIGYNRDNLVILPYNDLVAQHLPAFKADLMASDAVSGVSISSSPTTGVWSSANNLDWKGKDPNRQEVFGTILIDPDYGNVIGWKIREGRNFSGNAGTDSSGFLLNEAAVKQMGLQNPVGEIVKWHGRNWTVLGVVGDMVMTSPFDPTTPIVFLMDNKERSFNVINIKLNPSVSAAHALEQMNAVYKRYAPGFPFDYKFADTQYALKYVAEERIGKLSLFFTSLAIFISCLGLFGMVSFIAERRTKEIGVRKILGASVWNLWALLSKEFLWLVVISCCIAAPTAYYMVGKWLQGYQYRTPLSWWLFATACSGALLITLLTVSYQSIKTALTNPVKSLRTE